MSSTALVWAWGLNLPPRKKFLLVTICNGANADIPFDLNVKSLAERTCMDSGEVAALVTELVHEDKLIMKTEDGLCLNIPEDYL